MPLELWLPPYALFAETMLPPLIVTLPPQDEYAATCSVTTGTTGASLCRIAADRAIVNRNSTTQDGDAATIRILRNLMPRYRPAIYCR